jgi:hypothetical protein
VKAAAEQTGKVNEKRSCNVTRSKCLLQQLRREESQHGEVGREKEKVRTARVLVPPHFEAYFAISQPLFSYLQGRGVSAVSLCNQKAHVPALDVESCREEGNLAKVDERKKKNGSPSFFGSQSRMVCIRACQYDFERKRKARRTL